MCVLVVEDDTLIRTILLEELSEQGWASRGVGSGDQAASMLESLAPELCAVVTDIHMPGALDGIALAELVRARVPLLPIIFTTGRPDALLRLGSLGDTRFLVRKPYVPEDVLSRLRSAVTR